MMMIEQSIQACRERSDDMLGAGDRKKRGGEQWIVVAKGGWSWGPNGSKWESKVVVRGRMIEIGSVGGGEVLVMVHLEL